MKHIPHEWLYPPSTKDAVLIQREMAQHVVLKDDFGKIDFVGGMDVSNNRYDPLQMIYSSTVVLCAERHIKIEQATHAEKQEFPYITGLLGFREAPSVIKSWKKLRQKPDLIMVDGHGFSHPRGIGIASHLGLLLDVPSIGVAKTILVGKVGASLGEEAGSQVPLVWKGNIIGVVLRTRLRSHPIIISAGHRISLDTAVKIVKNSLRKYRLPIPTREAHLAANECRREYCISN